MHSHEEKLSETKAVEPAINNRVTVVSGNTDGKNLFMEISVFDGEHTNILRPLFPFDTSSKELSNYVKGLIDHKVELPPEIQGMLGISYYYDNKEETYFSKQGDATAVRLKDKDGVFFKK